MRSIRGLGLSLLMLCAASAQESARGAGSRDVFVKVCNSCHKVETVVANRRTKTQWEDVIEKMIARGAKGTDDEFSTALDHLVAQYGRVNVNRATAGEIVEVAGLPEKDADQIVKHRRANGKFEDFEALSKVPDIDLKLLEKNREALSF